VTALKYFGKTATNQNSMHKKVKSGLNLGTAIYHSVYNIFFFYQVAIQNKTKVKIRRTTSIVSPVVLIRVLNLVSPTKGNTQAENENKMLKYIYGCTRDGVTRVQETAQPPSRYAHHSK
jgi:hypothetical protein